MPYSQQSPELKVKNVREKLSEFGLSENTDYFHMNNTHKVVGQLLEKYEPKIKNLLKSNEYDRAWDAWETVGLYYLMQDRPIEALSVFSRWYDELLELQTIHKVRLHKGKPLILISDCYWFMDWPSHSKRFLMCALIEDIITDLGNIRQDRGAVFRAKWRHQLSQLFLEEVAYSVQSNSTEFIQYPDAVLHNLPFGWQNEIPSIRESRAYVINRSYVKEMVARLGDKQGKNLELLMFYLLICIPGIRAQMRLRTRTCEFDIVGSIDGTYADFRSELGRYFACECKNRKSKSGYPDLAKFAMSLLGIKSQLGIFVSTNGMSGQANTTDAKATIQRIYSESGTVIIAIDKNDLLRVKNGANFVDLMQIRYEQVRLDLNRK